MRSRIITAIDIGSSSIKLLSVAQKLKDRNFAVLSQRQALSAGIRKGVVIDIPKASESIEEIVRKAEQDCNQRIETVYANIGGAHLSSNSSHGLVSVSRADRKISEEDIERVLQAAQTFSLSSNKEIIDIYPREYAVDGQGGIKEPLGMEGVRLEADVLVLCGFSPYLKNSSQAIANSGFHLQGLIPTALASSRAVLNDREKELGVCVLDIGAGSTDMSVFEEGGLIHVAVFPVGSANITNDIAICLKTDINTAEKIKLEFGSCKRFGEPEQKGKKSEKKILLEGEDRLSFSKKILSDIIEARVSEIFELANKELKKISKFGTLPAGVVLTGGGAKLPGIKELAKEEFKLPCRIGFPEEFFSAQQDPCFSAVCGLVLEAGEMDGARDSWQGVRERVGGKLRKFFRIFIP